MEEIFRRISADSTIVVNFNKGSNIWTVGWKENISGFLFISKILITPKDYAKFIHYKSMNRLDLDIVQSLSTTP